MPEGFTLPQGLEDLGESFFSSTWQSCASLTHMPEGFNLPQGITNIKRSLFSSAWS
jgi:hypothetical protein